jgi:hypothetical protein
MAVRPDAWDRADGRHSIVQEVLRFPRERTVGSKQDMLPTMQKVKAVPAVPARR